jgi:aspartate/methionine/tyrosine aminotransferase
MSNIARSIKPFGLERYFARHEFSARHLLGSSDPQAMTIAELLQFEPEAESRIGEIWLGYTESLGDPALRHDIAGLYEKITPEQILVFTGAEEPIFTFMHTALEPGDHLIVHFPCYQSHYAIAESRGIEISKWQARAENNWAPDLNELQKLIKQNTRAILICTPHNPTGYLFDYNSWQEVISVARRHNLYLFCDEVYRGTEHNQQHQLPNMADHYEKGISLNCLSKNCGLAGLRTGWIATCDTHLFQQMASFKDYLTICNCAPGEFLAGIAVRNMDKILLRQRQRLLKNLDILADFFSSHKDLFIWKRPIAGPTTFPEFTGGDAMEFCDDLIAKTGIMLIPGIFLTWKSSICGSAMAATVWQQ